MVLDEGRGHHTHIGVDLVLMVSKVPQHLDGGELLQIFQVLNLGLPELVIKAVHRRKRVEQGVRVRRSAVRFIATELAGGLGRTGMPPQVLRERVYAFEVRSSDDQSCGKTRYD